jgi:hypothetical protein
LAASDGTDRPEVGSTMFCTLVCNEICLVAGSDELTASCYQLQARAFRR